MDTVVKMSPNLVEFIASATSKMSFRDATEEINRNTEEESLSRVHGM